MYAEVIIDNKSRYLDKSFTYQVPKYLRSDLRPGMRVLVPFGKGNKPVIAFVYKLVDSFDGNYSIKDIKGILDNEKIVSDELLKLAFFMQARYLSSYQASIRQILPPGDIKEVKVTYFSKKQNEKSDLLEFLDKERTYEQIEKKFGKVKDDLKKLKASGKIGIRYEIKSKNSIKYNKIIYLEEDYDHGLLKNSPKQKIIVDFLSKKGPCDMKELLALTKSSKSSIDSLRNKGIIRICKKENKKILAKRSSSYKKFELNEEQNIAYKSILKSKTNKFLLQGVTGSGKTEVFLQLVEENLNKGKDTIILVPEISLTPQTIQRFTGRFNQKIAVIHSRLTPQERFDQRRMIKNGETKIVIGARSAIFAPFENLGLIIIDEEHDQSYISSQDPKYNTREVAEFRADFNKAKLILASATPSLKAVDLAKNGSYKLLQLNHRINNSFPSISLVDMREELKNNNYSMISRKLFNEIKKNLNNHEQTILFLNKIGHNSFTFCRACGYIVKCDACDVAMTYHKGIDRLVCHYCGRTKSQPRICPNCGSNKIKEFGAGTEKLEEEVKKLFPDARILRMDSETAKTKTAYDNMYRKMIQGEVDILLGTQMIAKGLDFQNVTLVGIVAADLSLNFDDYTAEETTYQLLTQVSGRAGRAEKEGRVIIQTYNPDNFVIQAAKNMDNESFYKHEMDIRRAFHYPPYTNLITIKIINQDRIKTIERSIEFRDALEERLEDPQKFEIFGPNPCKISRINNKYRYNIIVKADNKDLESLFSCLRVLKSGFDRKYQDTSFIISLNPANIN